MSEKTEKPTAQRLAELRKKGVLARSGDVGPGVALLVLAVLTPQLVHGVWQAASAAMTTLLRASATSGPGQAGALVGQCLAAVAGAAAPLVLAAALAGTLASALVTRARPGLSRLRPKAEPVHPKNGLKKVLGRHGLVEAGKGLAKLVLVGAVVAGVLPHALSALLAGPGTLEALVSVVGGTAATLLLDVAALAFGLGLLDAVLSRRRYNKQARMSRDEVKQELKSSEGDPHLKAVIRGRQAAMSRRRMVNDVARADVVLANPTHIAIALVYTEADGAPKVIARGAGHLATRIKAAAAAAGVPVQENRPLARALYASCRVGSFIPPELYDAVAAVLAAVYATRRRGGRR